MPTQHSSGDLLADRRYRYAEACLADGDFSGAADLAGQALEIAPRYAPAWLLLGRAREGLAARSADPALREAAARAYARALDIDPDDGLGVRAHVVRLGGGEPDGPPALSPAYLRALFDGYAPRFERHLVDGLGYVGPALLREALPPEPERFAAALDLGCGTGLVGAAIRDRVGHLAGIDLSPGMIARAGAKRHAGRPLYDRLVTEEVGAFLARAPGAGFDLCLAADVMIYLGDLAPVLAAIARVLRPGGLAAFTLQSHDGDGFVLGADGRYAHADAHLAAAAGAAGLAGVTLRAAGIRREAGRPVAGRVVVLRCGTG